MSLSERLKEARADKEWRKVDLQRAAKLKSASTLTELEKGDITESPQLPAIANALGVEIMWLKYGKGEKLVSKGLTPDELDVVAAYRALDQAQKGMFLIGLKMGAARKRGPEVLESTQTLSSARLVAHK